MGEVYVGIELMSDFYGFIKCHLGTWGDYYFATLFRFKLFQMKKILKL